MERWRGGRSGVEEGRGKTGERWMDHLDNHLVSYKLPKYLVQKEGVVRLRVEGRGVTV